ncbi:hypothetical protein [Comamonas antarctica]|uniref:hypothetical protein n=1 Tax=Comamonas antarctica TaxID=2743470 RepID=UPI0028E4FD75|nr:hypothetical protein [Comamonas antarctica]
MTNTPTPASHAARLLREAAEELKQAHTIGGLGEWKTCEPEVRAVYDEHIAVAVALEASTASHAVNTAPISANVRGIEQAAPQHVATVWVDDEGCNDFELTPWFSMPAGEYKLYTGAAPASPEAQNHPEFPDGCAAPASPAQQDAPAAQPARECLQQSAEPLPTVELVGIKDGVETSLSPITMPPSMKARELLREYGFGDFQDDMSQDSCAMAAMESLIEYCQRYYAAPAAAALQAAPPAPPVGRASDDGRVEWFDPIPEGGAFVYAAPPAPAAVVPDIEVAVLMNRSACQKFPNDINMRLAHNAGWHARAALAAAPAQASDTESVLIDGIAYRVPAAVAGELLSLHLDLLAAATAQAVAVPKDDEDGLPGGFAHWYNNRFARRGADTQRMGDCEESWRAALAAAPAQAVAVPDEFRGDTAALVRNITALLELDAEGALVPHGVGGHARGLLAAAAARLSVSPAQEHATQLAGQGQEVTDGMALAFHHAITDGSIGQADVEEIKTGLRAVLCHAAAPIQAQEDARDLEAQALRACRDLPEGWEVTIRLEKGYGGVVLIDPDYNENELPVEGTLFDALKETIDTAIRDDAARAAQGGAA